MLQRLHNYIKSISIDCVAVCIYFLCMPLTIVTTPFGSLLKVVTMPVLAILCYKTFFGETKRLSFNSVHLMYAIYLLYTFLSLFFLASESAIRTVKDMFLAYFSFLLMSMRVYNENEKSFIENTWIVVGIVCICLLLTSNRVANQIENRAMIDIMGYSEDPNMFCSYFIMPVMVIMKRLTFKSKLKPLYALLLILILYSVLKTGSRGRLVAIVLGIGVFVILGIKKPLAKLGVFLAMVLVAVFVVGVVFPLLPEDVQERYSIESVVEDKGAGRFEIWELLVNYTLEEPSRIIRGDGVLSTEQSLEIIRGRETARGAHNQFIQVFADQGIIGLLLFLAFAAACFFRTLKRESYCACAFVSIMFIAMSLSFYVFKPYVNIVIMCALTFEGNTRLEGYTNEIEEKIISEAV